MLAIVRSSEEVVSVLETWEASVSLPPSPARAMPFTWFPQAPLQQLTLQFHLADIHSPSMALVVGAAQGRCARVPVLSPAGPGDPAAVSQDAARVQGRW